jgi:hypothetical protein
MSSSSVVPEDAQHQHDDDGYDDLDFLSSMDEMSGTGTVGSSSSKSTTKSVSDRMYRLKKKEYVTQLESRFIKKARTVTRTWEMIVMRMGSPVMPPDVLAILSRLIIDVGAVKYRSNSLSSSITSEIWNLQGILPSSASHALSLKIKADQRHHDEVASRDSAAEEAAAPPGGASTLEIAKWKNRESARKNRLKKKQYILVLEEGLLNLVRVLKQLRDIIISNLGENALPPLLVEAIALSSDSGEGDRPSTSTSSSDRRTTSGNGGRTGAIAKAASTFVSSAATLSATSSTVSLSHRSIGSSADAAQHQPGFVVMNPHLINDPIILCDPTFERRTGYPMKEVLGRHISFLMQVCLHFH